MDKGQVRIPVTEELLEDAGMWAPKVRPTDEYRVCRICLVEFEPKTPKVHVVSGAVHEGCYDKYVREEAAKDRASGLLTEECRRD